MLKRIAALIILIPVFFVKVIAPYACETIHLNGTSEVWIAVKECNEDENAFNMITDDPLVKGKDFTVRIALNYVKDINVIEGFIKNEDERFIFLSIKPLIENGIIFNSNRDFHDDDKTAYFVLTKIGGFDDAARVDVVDITVKYTGNETADSIREVYDSLTAYVNYFNEKGEEVGLTGEPVETDCDEEEYISDCVPCDVVGDFNEDGRVTGADLAIASAYYGIKMGDFNWYTSGALHADINGDKVVDEEDIATIAFIASNPQIRRVEEPEEELEEVPHEDSDTVDDDKVGDPDSDYNKHPLKDTAKDVHHDAAKDVHHQDDSHSDHHHDKAPDMDKDPMLPIGGTKSKHENDEDDNEPGEE